MEQARLSSLLVIALCQLSQTEISSTVAESWYAANAISDGVYSPRPLSEIFSTVGTFSSTNPIVVLPSSPTTPNSVISTSTLPNIAVSTTLSSTLGTTTEIPAAEVSVVPLSTERPFEPQAVVEVSSQLPQNPTIFVDAIQTTQTPQPPQSSQFPQPLQFQQPPAPPSPILSTPQQIQIQTAPQGSPVLPQLIQNQPPNYFVLYQPAPQTIQNSPPNLPQTFPSNSPQVVTSTSLPPSTSTPLPLSDNNSITTQAPCATNTPSFLSQTGTQFPTFRIRMVAPSGSVTNVRINANPTADTTTTRRPSTTRTRRNRNNYDGCINGCGGTRLPICASPLGVSPIDPDTLKGFPSVCHMACHNSFRRILYEKVMDGKCGRLRTRIQPINANKLKKDDLNKATYTIVQDGPGVVEFSPLNT